MTTPAVLGYCTLRLGKLGGTDPPLLAGNHTIREEIKKRTISVNFFQEKGRELPSAWGWAQCGCRSAKVTGPALSGILHSYSLSQRGPGQWGTEATQTVRAVQGPEVRESSWDRKRLSLSLLASPGQIWVKYTEAQAPLQTP